LAGPEFHKAFGVMPKVPSWEKNAGPGCMTLSIALPASFSSTDISPGR
jgi:hypothetical protein